jgi:Flp pilus assembly protein TadG
MTLDNNGTTAVFKQIIRDLRGVSVIEFAIALPLFLTAILGGLEIANMAIMQQRVAEIASEIAQNSARGNNQIDEASSRRCA